VVGQIKEKPSRSCGGTSKCKMADKSDKAGPNWPYAVVNSVAWISTAFMILSIAKCAATSKGVTW
jgi:hypothetical protein